MAYENNNAPQEQGAPDALKEKKRSGGGVLAFLLCIVLIAAGAGLMYMDINRDYRHGVYRCEDGRMMEEPAEPAPNKTSDFAHSAANLAKTYPGIQQYIMLVPTAACIQPVYLPEGAQVRDQKADLAEIRSRMPSSLQWIDLVEVFSDHTGEKLYYASDTYLTGWGSRYAAKTALTAMGAEMPEGKDKCYLLSNSFVGRLAQDRRPSLELFEKSGERLEIYVPEEEARYYRIDGSSGAESGSLYDSNAAKGREPYDVFFGGERALTEIRTTAINGETLLVIGDRTADSIVPRFVSSFEKIVLMHPSMSAKTVSELVEEYEVTKILYLYSANEYMTDMAVFRSLK